MTGRVVATALDRSALPAVERRYEWAVATLAEGRRNVRGLARRGTSAYLVRADGKIER